ncbi:MAG TPA: hypothetical protein VEC38_05410 [Candidatus Binataceae bacterium]|nr:hypothetical protein [Candidatus Binataceae bacterium]
MRHLFSRIELQALSSVLAAALLLGSIPLTTGVVLVCGPIHPELTVNICYPIQSFDRMSNGAVARPAAAVLKSTLFDLGCAAGIGTAPIIERGIVPDTPPPKRI